MHNNLLDAQKLQQLNKSRIKNILRFYIYNLGYMMPSYNILKQMLLVIYAKDDAKPLVKWGNYSLRRYQKLLYFIDNNSKIDNSCPLYLLFKNKDNFEIRYKQLGQKVKFSNKKHSQSVKKLMQEYKIPPWQRNSIRFYYVAEELVAIEKIGKINVKEE